MSIPATLTFVSCSSSFSRDGVVLAETESGMIRRIDRASPVRLRRKLYYVLLTIWRMQKVNLR